MGGIAAEVAAGYAVSHGLVLVVGAEQIVVADFFQECFFECLAERAEALLFVVLIEDDRAGACHRAGGRRPGADALRGRAAAARIGDRHEAFGCRRRRSRAR